MISKSILRNNIAALSALIAVKTLNFIQIDINSLCSDHFLPSCHAKHDITGRLEIENRKSSQKTEGNNGTILKSNIRRRNLNHGKLRRCDLINEVVDLLKTDYVDKRMYDKRDWIDMRRKSTEFVERRRKLGMNHSTSKKLNNGYEQYEIIDNLLSQLVDPYTIHLKPSMFEAKIQDDDGVEMGMGIELKRSFIPTYLPIVLQQQWPASLSAFQYSNHDDSFRKLESIINNSIWYNQASYRYDVLVAAVLEIIFVSNRKGKRTRLPVITLCSIGLMTGIDLIGKGRPLIVQSVSVCSAAYENGIRPGDHILQVNERPYHNINIHSLNEKQSSELLFWTPGSNVVNKAHLEMRPMERVTVDWAVKLGKNGIKLGYVGITDFSRQTGLEVQEALRKLLENGVQHIILDLRDNPGGSIMGSIEVPSFFLPNGTPVVLLENGQGKKRMMYTMKCDLQCLDIPLIVLANEGTASASEIVIGALKCSGRALILGQTTYGKGLAQGVYMLSDGSGISLSIFRMYTPNGLSFHDIGICPHKTINLHQVPGKKLNFKALVEMVKDIDNKIT